MKQLSSKNKRILVFSDPHQEIDRVENIIQKEAADEIVCLGDWFDSHHYNSIEDARKTIEFLKKNISNPDFYTLIGNHDVGYLYEVTRYTQCSGFSNKKKIEVERSFGSAYEYIRSQFNWYIWIDDVLCTHAGLNQNHIWPVGVETDMKSLSAFLDKAIEDAQVALLNGDQHWIFSAGVARGGRQPKGGITWQDFYDEHRPIEGLKQLFGHTHSWDNTIKTFNKFSDTCIDTGLN